MKLLKDEQYYKYAQDIIDGKIVACKAIKLAAKRFLSWFERDDIYFDQKAVHRCIKFISCLKHSTGQHARKPFILLPWQSFCIANIFGWKYKDTNLRVTSNVFIMISRKAGKTAFAAAIALYCAVADNEPNAEIELVANTRQQATIAFGACDSYAESIDPTNVLFHHNKQVLRIPSTKSTIQVLASEAMNNDGYNSSCFILDEFHASKDWDLYNVMKSSQGMRSQPLAIVITTAGFLLAPYPCYTYRETCMDILEGRKEDDTTFSAIFELDEGDDWTDENNWLKCAPSLGQTVSYKYLRDQVQSALNQPAQEVGVKTKNFNMFCQSSEVWIPDAMIESNMQKVNLKDFQGQICYMGVDLSAVSDLTCTAVMFPPDPTRKKYPDKFVFKCLTYLPKSQLTNARDNRDLYSQWMRNKHLIMTDGNVVDYNVILEDQCSINESMDLVAVAYDSWNATQWAIEATNAGLNLQPYSQALGNFNKPTKTFERLLKNGDIILDKDPILRWCFQNVVLKTDWNDNCKPTKPDVTKKIDCVIACLQALGSYLVDNA